MKTKNKKSNNKSNINLKALLKRYIFLLPIFLVLIICNLKFNDLSLNINYVKGSNYKGQTTLYYSDKNDEFTEEKSFYSTLNGDKTSFPYYHWDRIFLIPNRVIGQSTQIESLTFTCHGIPLWTVSDTALMNGYRQDHKQYSDLVFTSTEDNPYPELKFSFSFYSKLSWMKYRLAVFDLILSLIELGAIYIAITFVRKSKVFKTHRAIIIFNAVTAIVILASMSYFNRFNIAVDYETDLSGEQSTVYYNYDDKGFREINSVYSTIDGKTGNNIFYSATAVEGVNLAPNRAVTTVAYINDVKLYKEGVLIANYTPEMLWELCNAENTSAELENGKLRVETTEINPYPVISFNSEFASVLNTFNLKVFALDVVKVLMLFALLMLCTLIYHLTKRHSVKPKKALVKRLCLALASIAILTACWFVKSPLALISVPVLTAILGLLDIKIGGKRWAYPVVAFVLSAVFMLNSEVSPLYNSAYTVYTFWNVCLALLASLSYIAVNERLLGACTDNTPAGDGIANVAGLFVKLVAIVFIYEYIKTYLVYDYQSVVYCTRIMLGAVLQINLLWLFALVLIVYGLVGIGLTNTLGGILSFVLIAGNTIKLIYHSTLLTPADFMQIGDMLAIAPDIIGNFAFYAIILLFIAAVILLIINIKRILPHIKPRPTLTIAIISVFVLYMFTKQLIGGTYSAINVCDKPYIDEITNEYTNGVGIYNMFKIKHIPDMFMTPPDGYTKENVLAMKNEFDNLATDSESEVKPNIIFVLAESFFDMNRIEDFTFSEDIIPNARQMGVSGMLSPRYGGYTAAVEYEALTGNSLAFYPQAVIPYTAYFTKKNREMPSLPLELKADGYATYAIHPNVANFYNRDKAYEMMGFDKYISIADFNGAPCTINNFVKDTAVVDKIKQTIDSTDEPVFAFAITIESHYTDAKRYDETEIKVSGDNLTEDDITALEQQAQAYREFDKALGQLKEYIDSCDEPTLLYVFGDHLPPVSAFSKTEFINNPSNKYQTATLCYSNYKDISLPSGITPNYLSAQIFADSGVAHSSYFDYIYSIRDEIPALHKEFIQIDTENNELLKKYYTIQYDVMFGNKWFYRNTE